ncbi:hypothetical protein MN608_05217 [Microdochium nivale]|nr:hypothetical protein MN608_05217 [Microdochium nivale]
MSSAAPRESELGPPPCIAGRPWDGGSTDVTVSGTAASAGFSGNAGVCASKKLCALADTAPVMISKFKERNRKRKQDFSARVIITTDARDVIRPPLSALFCLDAG